MKVNWAATAQAVVLPPLSILSRVCVIISFYVGLLQLVLVHSGEQIALLYASDKPNKLFFSS